MTTEISHRGPDDEGIWSDDGITLGHRRLSIFDLSSAGHQPMHRQNRYIVSYNGEIYNWKSLRQRLEARGLRFRTNTDTEVLLAMYEHYGIAMLDQMEGMFAFALWDRASRVLHLVRDRYGVKPLFYLSQGCRVAFASELRCFRHLDSLGGIDGEALAVYAATGYIPAPMTIWQHVRRLPPGHRLEVRPGEPPSDPIRWFDPVTVADNSPVVPTADRLPALETALQQAVAIRLEADVPVGVFLSGGIDSGIVASLAARTNKPITTLTVGFSDVPFYDESARAKATARAIGSDHREINLTAADAEDAIRQVLDRIDEPFADDSLIPTFLISRAARREVTVALAGDGADELFGGYRKYFATRWANVPGVSAIAPLISAVAAKLPDDRTSPSFNLVRKAARLAAGVTGTLSEQHRSLVGLLDPDIAREVLKVRPERDPLLEHLEKVLGRTAHWEDAISRILMADLEYVLPYDMLVKVDRASMWNSLEVRSPFLDRRVLPLAFAFSGTEHVGYRTNKLVLRGLARDLLPPEVRRAKKQGFGVPLGHWFRTSLQPLVRDALDPAAVAKSGLLDPGTTSDLIDEHARGTKDRSWEIWNALVLQTWADRYL